MSTHLPPFPALLAALLLATLIAACATVPETGRSQLRLISAGEEMQMGLSQFEEIKQDTPISKDAEATAMVERVGRRIAAVAPLEGAQWEFVLFDAPDTANAFCLPGGKVGVYSGLLPIARDEAGLATVVGHEVAHAVAHHGAERVSQSLLVEMGGQVLAEALTNQPGATRTLTMAAYGLGSQVGVLLPYSRKHEAEADHLGLLYMARAGYDPRAAVAFWERFAAAKGGEGGPGFEWLSTHPLDATRIANLKALMPQALADYEAARR